MRRLIQNLQSLAYGLTVCDDRRDLLEALKKAANAWEAYKEVRSNKGKDTKQK